MASIKQRGNSYLVTVSCGYDSQGKKITKSKTFKKPNEITPKKWEKELNKLALEFETEVQKGLFVDSDITLSAFTDRWLKEYGEKQLQPKTIESYKDELNSKILPALGHIKLNKLTPVQILSFLNNLLEDGVRADGRPGGYSDRTIKYQWQILSSILQQAVYWQVIPENPCKRVKAPKNTKDTNQGFTDSKIKYYNEEQTLLLLDIIKNEHLKYQVAFNIAIFCGLRNGEILGLTWNDIDLKNKTISINKARSYLKGKGMFTKQPKAESSVRIISMPDTLVKLLREYKVWQNGEKANCGDQWSEEWNDTPWLMTQWNGKGMASNVLTKWLYKVIHRHNKAIEKDTNLSDKEKEKLILPILGFHALRHTSATLLIGQNTDIKTVSARLGHSQTSTTMNIYVHGLRSADTKAANALENLLNKDSLNIKNA